MWPGPISPDEGLSTKAAPGFDSAVNRGGNFNTGYNVGFGNGNQSSFVFQNPVNVSCNSVAVFGFAQSC